MPHCPEDRWFAEFCQHGRPEALARVFDRVGPELLRVALHLVRDRHSAEDLVQTTFLHAIDDRQNWDPNRPVLPWLLGILTNRARHMIRQRRRRFSLQRASKRPGAGAASQVSHPMDLAADQEWAEALANGIRDLDEPYRHVLRLHLDFGLSPGEIADAHGRSPSTVRTQLARGIELLRKALPVGFAVGLGMAVAPAAGIRAVRAAVLERASTGFAAQAASTIATNTAIATIGTMTMKKVSLLLVLIVLACGYWAWPTDTPVGPPAEAGPKRPLVAGGEMEERPGDATPLDVAREKIDSKRPTSEGFGSVAIRVLWSDRTPAAAVGVRLYAWDGENGRAYRMQRITDGEGRIRWPRVAAGRIGLYPDRAEEIQGPSGVALTAGGHEDVEWILPRQLRVEGRVVTSEGHPVPGAQVWLHHNSADLGHRVAESDNLGQFTLRDVHGGYSLQARAAGHGPAYSVTIPKVAANTGATAVQGDTVKVELILEGKGATLRGTVVDHAGRPVQDAVVRVTPQVPQRLENGRLIPAPSAYDLRSDANGHFEAVGLNPGRVTVDARSPSSGVFHRVLDLANDATDDFAIELQPGGLVRGRVMDASGAAVSGVSVGYGYQYTEFDFAISKTDADGAYELRGLTEGERKIFAGNKERGRAGAVLAIRSGETIERDFVLSDGGDAQRVRGRVVDSAGRGMAGFHVQIRDVDWRTHWIGSSKTDAQGAFQVDHCPDMELSVELHLPESPGIAIEEQRPVRRGGPEVLFRVPTGIEKLACLTARLRNSANAPLVGARFSIMPTQGRSGWSVETDSRGVAKRNLPAIEYELSVLAVGYPQQQLGRRKLSPGETLDLGVITLQPPGTISCEVFDDKGEELDWVYLTLCSDTIRAHQNLRSHGSGEPRPPLAAPPGRHWLMCTARNRATRTQQVLVESGRTTTVKFTLPPGVARTIEFVLPENDGLRKLGATDTLEMSIRDARDAMVVRQSLPSEARKVEVLFSPGDYRVEITSRNGLSGIAQISVTDEPKPVVTRIELR